MANEHLRKTVYAILASGKNYAYIDAINLAKARTLTSGPHDPDALDTYMRSIARIEANAVVDMALEIERRLSEDAKAHE